MAESKEMFNDLLFVCIELKVTYKRGKLK